MLHLQHFSIDRELDPPNNGTWDSTAAAARLILGKTANWHNQGAGNV
jgi:hypothetical protein